MAITSFCVEAWAVAVTHINSLILAGAIAGVAATITLAVFTTPLIAAMSIGFTFTGLAGLLVPLVDGSAAFADIQAMRDVINDAYLALRGQTVNATTFNSRIQALTYPTGDHRYTLVSVIKSIASNRENYLAFCDTLGKAYSYRIAGVNESVCTPYTDWMGGAVKYQGAGDFEWIEYGILRLLNTTPAEEILGGSYTGWYQAGIQLPAGWNYRVKPLAASWIAAAAAAPAGAPNQYQKWVYDGNGSQVGTTEAQFKAFTNDLGANRRFVFRSYGAPQISYFSVTIIP
jgi:hypothetical protein